MSGGLNRKIILLKYLCTLYASLVGVDFAGEKHPVNCPCQKREEKERLDRERMDKRKAEEEEKKLRAEQEEKRLEQQRKVDQQIEMKKKQFYRKMNGSGSSYKTGGSEMSDKSASALRSPSGITSVQYNLSVYNTHTKK